MSVIAEGTPFVLLSQIQLPMLRCLLAGISIFVLNTATLAMAGTLQGVSIVKAGVDEPTLASWETALQENNTPVQLVESVSHLATSVSASPDGQTSG